MEKVAKIKKKYESRIICLRTIITWSGVACFSFFGFGAFYIFWSYLSGYSLCGFPDTEVLQTNAVSIANTYMVYTTIMLTAFSILLVIGGFAFSHQFSIAKEEQTIHLLNELEKQLKENKFDFGIKFIQSTLANKEVQRYFEDIIEKKVDQLKEESEANGDDPETAGHKSDIAGAIKEDLLLSVPDDDECN